MKKKNEGTKLFEEVCEAAMESITVKKFEDVIKDWEADKLMDLKAETKAVDMTGTYSILISVLSTLIATCSMTLSIVGDVDVYGCVAYLFKMLIIVVALGYAVYVLIKLEKNRNKYLYKECILLAIENVERKRK